MNNFNNKELILSRDNVNQKHILYYDKCLDILTFVLDEFSRDITRDDIEFLELPKNMLSTFDFLISSISKIQKGQRLALGLDNVEFEEVAPQINIIEGLTESKI